MKIILHLILSFFFLYSYSQSGNLNCTSKGETIYVWDGIIFNAANKVDLDLIDSLKKCKTIKKTFIFNCLEFNEEDIGKFTRYSRQLNNERNTFTAQKSIEENCIDRMNFTLYSSDKLYLDGIELNCEIFEQPNKVSIKFIKKQNFLFFNKLSIYTN